MKRDEMTTKLIISKWTSQSFSAVQRMQSVRTRVRHEFKDDPFEYKFTESIVEQYNRDWWECVNCLFINKLISIDCKQCHILKTPTAPTSDLITATSTVTPKRSASLKSSTNNVGS